MLDDVRMAKRTAIVLAGLVFIGCAIIVLSPYVRIDELSTALYLHKNHPTAAPNLDPLDIGKR